MFTVNWIGGVAFEAQPPSGNKFVMDSHPDFGGRNLGPSPLELLLGAIAGCSAVDVVSILEKKRQKLSSYRIEIEGVRVPPGEFPRPYTSITIRHIVSGEGLDPAAVERAVELSDNKYCSVIATLRQSPEIISEWQIEEH